MPVANDNLAASFAQACNGLLFPSETDAPITPVFWDHEEVSGLDPSKLLTHENLPTDTPVETVAFDTFFDRYDPAQGDPEAPKLIETLKQLQALRAALASSLTSLSVFRVGKIDIGIFILGLTSAGDVAGVKTRAVET